ncbi:uncharacterized protein LOC144551794 [Carex rostrata]
MQIIPQTYSMPVLHLTQRKDKLVWRWDSSGLYSAKSAYHEVLTSGGCIKEGSTVICIVTRDCGVVESAMHLFFQCTHAKRVWYIVHGMIGVRLMHTDVDVQRTFIVSNSKAQRAGLSTKMWSVFFAATCWGIWKQRRKLLFEVKRPNYRLLVEQVVQEGWMWWRFC